VIPQIVTAIVAGILSHQTKPIIDNLDTSSQTVRNLSSYGIGYLTIGIVFEVFLSMSPLDLDIRQRWIVRSVFWLAGIFTGLGVFFGYVLDSLLKRRK
jgi:hypothetical protein